MKERFQALMIDAVLIFFVEYLAFSGLDNLGMEDSAVKMPLYILLFALYEPLLVTLTGGTVGHHVAKIMVRKASDPEKKLNIVQAVIRFAMKVLLGWVSLLTITANKEKRALHDLVGNAVVLSK
ncbi:MAG: RDD family protein [Bacteroidia bacterium]